MPRTEFIGERCLLPGHRFHCPKIENYRLNEKPDPVWELPTGSGFCVSRNAFKVLTHIQINYCSSFLGKGKAGKVYGGMSLPRIETANGDNFTPLRSVDWQIYIYGIATPELADFAR